MPTENLEQYRISGRKDSKLTIVVIPQGGKNSRIRRQGWEEHLLFTKKYFCNFSYLYYIYILPIQNILRGKLK